MLNKSVSYFKNADEYIVEEFNASVFENPEIKASFDEYTNNEFQESFPINNQAVKKNTKFFKSVIKLDKNFHIYIHGDPNKIEKGVESDGRKFYKVYFDEEI